jgi:hypothetical protein
MINSEKPNVKFDDMAGNTKRQAIMAVLQHQ